MGYGLRCKGQYGLAKFWRRRLMGLMVVLGASSVCDFGGFNFNFFELGLH